MQAKENAYKYKGVKLHAKGVHSVDKEMMSRACITQKTETQTQKPEIEMTQNSNAKTRN